MTNGHALKLKLCELMESAFSPQELEQFLEQYYPSARSGISFQQDRKSVVFDAVDLLSRQGLIDEALLDAVAASRPGRGHEVDLLRELLARRPASRRGDPPPAGANIDTEPAARAEDRKLSGYPLVIGWLTWAVFGLFVIGPFVMAVALHQDGVRDAWPVVAARSLGLIPMIEVLMKYGVTPWGFIAGMFGGLGAIASLGLRFSELRLAFAHTWQQFAVGVGVPCLMSLLAAVACALIKALFGWTVIENLPLVATIGLGIGFSERLLNRP